MAIYVKPDESLDSALKRFKKECTKANTLVELKKREYYMPPSEKRRRKSELAQRKLKKKLK